MNWKAIAKIADYLFPERKREILMVLLGFPLLVLGLLMMEGKEELKSLKRPGFLEKKPSLYLNYQLQEEEIKDSIAVDLGMEQESRPEMEAKLEEAAELFAEKYLGKPQKKIDQNWKLPANYQGIKVEYQIEPKQSLLANGDWNYWGLFREKESQWIELRAVFSYQDLQLQKKRKWQLEKTDFSPIYVKQLLKNQIKKELEKLSAQNGESLILPEQIEGKKIIWQSYHNDFSLGQMAFYYVLIFLALIMISHLAQKEKKRNLQKQFQKDFIQMLHQLILLLKSGKTPENAFALVCQNGDFYGHTFKELLRQCQQRLYHQEPVGKVIKLFYERCPLPEIEMFEQLFCLAQDRGDSFSIVYLEQLRDELFTQRLKLAYEYSQKASSRLIFPMLIYLLIVISLTVFPAFEQGF